MNSAASGNDTKHDFLIFLNRFKWILNEILAIINASAQSSVATGEGNWNQLKTTFRTKDNTGQQFVYIGLLIESDAVLNTGTPLFIKDFTYTFLYF